MLQDSLEYVPIPSSDLLTYSSGCWFLWDIVITDEIKCSHVGSIHFECKPPELFQKPYLHNNWL